MMSTAWCVLSVLNLELVVYPRGASFRIRYEVVLVVSSPVKKDANVIERIGCCICRAKTGKILCGRVGSATIGYFGKVLYLLPAQYRSKDQKIVFQILLRSALPERVAMGPRRLISARIYIVRRYLPSYLRRYEGTIYWNACRNNSNMDMMSNKIYSKSDVAIVLR